MNNRLPHHSHPPTTIGNPLSIPIVVNLEDEAEAGEVWSSKTD